MKKYQGIRATRAYTIWNSMKKRCTNPNHRCFSRYGGRGITVCPRWFNSFENFLEDMGEPPHQSQIDRIDNDGNYEPNNCRWSTTRENQSNRSNNRKIEYLGETKTLSEWSRVTGISKNTLTNRLNHNWTVEAALTTPIDPKFSNREKIPRLLKFCECGCGGSFISPDIRGRDKKFIRGHNANIKVND